MDNFLDVNVKEGRLKEAPEKGSNAQNCGGLLHEFLTNLAPLAGVCPPPGDNNQRIQNRKRTET